MIISKIYNSVSEEDRENLTLGLIFGLTLGLTLGLTSGLIFGLTLGLIFGLTSGLIFGLTLGLTLGLTSGLIFGLTSGLTLELIFGLIFGLIVILVNFKEALPFLYSFYPILFLIIGIILISEIMFWLMPKEKLKKGTNLFWHTCKRKGENILEVLLVLSGIAQIYILTRELNKYVNYQLYLEVLKWIGYIGAGLLILGSIVLIFYVWIKLVQ
jgi:hypothetical protein